MKFVRLRPVFTFISIILYTSFFSSCKTLNESSDGCVVSFIIAAENRNMKRAWDILSPEAQQYYNSLGEKMRKSGKGALENEIARISKFKTVKKDYRVEPDGTDNLKVKLIQTSGEVHIIETQSFEGNYKLKNEQAVKTLLNAITLEAKKEEGY